MSKDKARRAVPDEETKRKPPRGAGAQDSVRRRRCRQRRRVGKVDHAHGSEAHQKMFRRKSGG